MLLDVEELKAEVEGLATGRWLGRIEAVAAPAAELLTPPTRISRVVRVRSSSSDTRCSGAGVSSEPMRIGGSPSVGVKIMS